MGPEMESQARVPPVIGTAARTQRLNFLPDYIGLYWTTSSPARDVTGDFIVGKIAGWLL
jgi:hypothetical protein